MVKNPFTTDEDRIAALALAHGRINPAAVQRRIQALRDQLLALTTSKAGARVNKRAPSRGGNQKPTRAS